MSEKNPRWKYDCFHCKFSWNCGPTCTCNSAMFGNPDESKERRCFAALRVDDTRDERVHRHGRMEIKSGQGARYRLIEVNMGSVDRRGYLKKGDRIQYRLQGKGWTWGKIKKISDACNNKPEHKTTRKTGRHDYPYVLELVRG